MKSIFFVILCILISSCSDVDNTRKVENMSLEEQLAVLDAKGPVDTTDIKVVRIRALLNFLSESYHEPKDTIAEYTHRITGTLHDTYGVEMTNLELLEEMNRVGQIDNTSYRDAVTLYAVLKARVN